MDFVREKERRIPVRYRIDVLVVGGGSAGLAAAIAAARLGADVLLVDRNGFLGGTLAMVTLGSICGLYAVTETQIQQIVHGFAGELVDRLKRVGAVTGPTRFLQTAAMPYDATALKLIADELVKENRIRLLFHCLAVDVLKEGDDVCGVIFEGRDGRWACHSKIVVDCTGDGDIATLAGVPFEHDLARNQAPSTMFRLGAVDTDRAALIDRDQLRRCLEQAVSAGLPLPRTAGGMFSFWPGVVHLNITRVLRDGRAPDALSAVELTEAELEGRRQVALYAEAFRKFVPGFEKSYVLDVGAQIGIRESRRIAGEYVLNIDDVLKQARFEDSIACSAWPLEEHGAGKATRWVFLEPGTYYQLPFRMLLPKRVDGLLVAGRCASASHEAHASMRVAAVCMALGEAAGVAAALAASSELHPRELKARSIQQQLRAQGAFLGLEGEVPPMLAS